MTSPSGWPDWTGETVTIVASGPSAKSADLSLVKGRAKVIAIKQCIDLCPWADMVYGCDAAWWLHRLKLPDYLGMKVCWKGNGLREIDDFLTVEIGINADPRVKYTDDLLIGEPGLVGGGGNSGFQAMNLAVNLGAPKIVLVGFDMNRRGGVHWYGRNNWSMANNPDESNFRRWMGAFERAAPVLKRMGVEVLNTSQHSSLQCFPKVSLKDAMH